MNSNLNFLLDYRIAHANRIVQHKWKKKKIKKKTKNKQKHTTLLTKNTIHTEEHATLQTKIAIQIDI